MSIVTSASSAMPSLSRVLRAGRLFFHSSADAIAVRDEAAADFAAPMGNAPVLSHARQDIAALCPDLVHEAERGLGRHLA
ncbi:MAG: hypothetical protein KGL12_15215 [Rhodospirillales bacterium]|nr:hypothetical protein [Rhodospirillales bacterium]